MALCCHDLAKQRQVTIVDVGAVERDHVVHLAFNGFANGFDSQALQSEEMKLNISKHFRCLSLDMGQDMAKWK